jgi:hypothetical protein
MTAPLPPFVPLSQVLPLIRLAWAQNPVRTRLHVEAFIEDLGKHGFDAQQQRLLRRTLADLDGSEPAATLTHNASVAPVSGDAHQAYAAALAVHKAATEAARQAVTTAEQAEEQSEERLLQAEQTYLDALGAPALGDLLPFDSIRVMRVTQRAIDRFSNKKTTPNWSVSGPLHQAKAGQWVQVKLFDTLKKAQWAKQTPADRAAHLQALLDASTKRAHRQAKGALRLGSNELDFLHCMKFGQGKTFRAPVGVLFAGHSLLGNIRIAKNLHAKGVLLIPDYKEPSSGVTVPEWYRQPMKAGPRAAEARVLMAQTPSIFDR